MLPALLLVLAAVPERGPAHPNSISASRIDLRGRDLVVAVEVQVLSLAEVVPSLDPDRDGRASDEEINRDAVAIGDYLARHYRLAPLPVDGASESAPVELLVPAGEAATWPFLAPVGAPTVRPAPLREGLFGELEQYVRVELRYVLSETPRVLGVSVDPFADTSPDHRDLCVVVWNGVELAAFDLVAEEARRVTANAEAVARGGSSFARYVARGLRSALERWPLWLLGFLLPLSTGCRKRRALIALTYGAAVAAGVGTFGAVTLAGRGARFVALALPLACAYVGADVMLARAARVRWLEALTFGAIAGLAAASALAPELARERATEFHRTSQLVPSLAGVAAATAGVVVLAGLLASTWRGNRAGRAVRTLGGAACALGIVAFVRVLR
jgi:hypothetical protein